MVWAHSEWNKQQQRWILILTEDTTPLPGWRDMASRLPIGERNFKREMKQRGGELVRMQGICKFGLAGIGIGEVSAMAFVDQAAADTALADVVHPHLLILNMTQKK